MCQTAGAAVPCQWNDTSQAEAYAHTLTAFYKAFPEYGANDLYMTGESYAGQYVGAPRGAAPQGCDPCGGLHGLGRRYFLYTDMRAQY